MSSLITRLAQGIVIATLVGIIIALLLLLNIKNKTIQNLVARHALSIDACMAAKLYVGAEKPATKQAAIDVLEKARIDAIMFYVDNDIATKEAQYIVYLETEETERSTLLDEDQKARFRSYLLRHDPGTSRNIFEFLRY